MTSFGGGVKLLVKHPRSKSTRLKYLPISPNPPHPDNGILLEQEGEPLRYKSCVQIGNARVFSSRILRPYGGRRLTARSFKTLVAHAGDIPMKSYVPDTEPLLSNSAMNPYVQRESATYHSTPPRNPLSTFLPYQNNHRYDTFNSHAGSSRPLENSCPDEGPSHSKIIVGLVAFAAVAYGVYWGIKTLFKSIMQSVRRSSVGAVILSWTFG